MKKSVNKFPAFTLAEVLIALAIIGFISVITLPALFNDTQEQVTVAQLSKFYKNLSDAYKITRVKHGPVSKWHVSLSQTQEDAQKVYEYLFKPNFKISKDCGFNNKENCIYNGTYKQLNGETYGTLASTGSAFYKLTLADGASVMFTPHGSQANTILVLYDVNGQEEPNQWGYDVFGFHVMNKGVVPEGLETNKFDSTCSKKDEHAGYGCAAWVIYKGNMGYLDCDDLAWNGKQQCDNDDE